MIKHLYLICYGRFVKKARKLEASKKFLKFDNKIVLDSSDYYMIERKGVYFFVNDKEVNLIILDFLIMEVLIFLRKLGIDTL